MRSKPRWRRETTKEIELHGKHGEGKVTLVDDEDYEWLNGYRWMAANGYAIANFDGRTKPMHRLTMGTPPGMYTDHIDGNILDNRKSNLRICTAKENMRNKGKHRTRSSAFKGVSWDAQTGRWRVQIGYEDHVSSVGRFETQIEAAFAYNEVASILFREFARLNTIPADALTAERMSEIVSYAHSWVERSTISG